MYTYYRFNSFSFIDFWRQSFLIYLIFFVVDLPENFDDLRNSGIKIRISYKYFMIENMRKGDDRA